jgi:hypothetical protein
MQKTVKETKEAMCALRSDFKVSSPMTDSYGSRSSNPSNHVTGYVHEIECAWNNFKKLPYFRAHR